MERKTGIYIAFTTIIFAMGFLLFNAFNSDTMVYSITVGELKAKGTSAYDKGFRITGLVEQESIVKSADQLSVSFVVKDSLETMSVVYDGVLPDTFKPPTGMSNEIPVVIEGEYLADGTFRAKNIMTKCASKYDPMEEARNYSLKEK